MILVAMWRVGKSGKGPDFGDPIRRTLVIQAVRRMGPRESNDGAE